MRILLAVLAVCCAVFFSCSDSGPSVSHARAFTVFDYAETDALPKTRLAVFVNVESDVRLADELRICNEESGLEWTAQQPVKVPVKDYAGWAGSAHIMPAHGKQLPQGRYCAVYQDYSGREAEAAFKVEYPVSFLQATAADFPGIIKAEYRKLTAAYSQESVLVYFGEQKQGSSSDALRNASVLRECYYMEDMSVVCLMPPVHRYEEENSDR